METQILHVILDKITSMETDIGKIKNTMATKDELTEIRNTMATKDDIHRLDATMTTIQHDVQLMKRSIFELDERTIQLDERTVRIEQKLNTIAKQVALNTELHTEQQVRIINIEQRVEMLEADTKLMKKVLVHQ